MQNTTWKLTLTRTPPMLPDEEHAKASGILRLQYVDESAALAAAKRLPQSWQRLAMAVQA